MAGLRTDSQICRRIVSSFIDFLQSVETTPDVDPEGLEVAKECLREVFKLNTSCMGGGLQRGLLVELFRSNEFKLQQQLDGNLEPVKMEETSCAVSSSVQFAKSNGVQEMKCDGQAENNSQLGNLSRDELFVRFYAALDKTNFFITSGGLEDSSKIEKATQFFYDAYEEMVSSQKQENTLANLAETFKLRGNELMRSNLYSDAVDLYTFAIAIHDTSAVYYCNRAAAFTQLQRYSDAIEDCLKSLEIDPSHSKAYSRLGIAYFGLGEYAEALNKGFLKALEMDPENNLIKENIQATTQKLIEQTQQAGSQNAGPSDNQESASQGSMSQSRGCPFASFPVNSQIPPEMANFLRNMTFASHGMQDQESVPNFSPAQASDDHRVRVDANVTVGLTEEAPQQLTDILRSVMGIFSSQNGSRDGPQGREQA